MSLEEAARRAAKSLFLRVGHQILTFLLTGIIVPLGFLGIDAVREQGRRLDDIASRLEAVSARLAEHNRYEDRALSEHADRLLRLEQAYLAGPLRPRE